MPLIVIIINIFPAAHLPQMVIQSFTLLTDIQLRDYPPTKCLLDTIHRPMYSSQTT